MGIRAVRSAPSRGQPCEGIGFTSGSAHWGRSRRSGNRVAAAVPTLEQPVRTERAPVFRATETADASTDVQATRAAGAASPLGKLGGVVALLFGCTARLCGFVTRETGVRSKTGGAGPRAVRSMPACRATEATATTSWRGRPCDEVGFVALGNWSDEVGFKVWTTRAVRFERSRGQPRGRTSFMASGTMYGARFIVWETGGEVCFAGSGNRAAKARIAEATLR